MFPCLFSANMFKKTKSECSLLYRLSLTGTFPGLLVTTLNIIVTRNWQGQFLARFDRLQTMLTKSLSRKRSFAWIFIFWNFSTTKILWSKIPATVIFTTNISWSKSLAMFRIIGTRVDANLPKKLLLCFNPFLVNVSVSNHLKTPENQRVSAVFRVHMVGILATDG